MKRIITILVCFFTGAILSAQTGKTIPVKARENSTVEKWDTYQALTVENLKGFKKGKEPALSKFSGYKVNRQDATGFFRTEQIAGRWWIIDPEGYPFHHRAVVAYEPGRSEKQQLALQEKFGTRTGWLEAETKRLRSYGFNGAGAWSAVKDMRMTESPLVYTVIVNPMGNYNHEQKKKYGGSYRIAGWQGYRFNLPMVFDKEFEEYVERSLAPLAEYKDDPYLLGYFTDNELPWYTDALDRHLQYLAKDEPGYLAAYEWLNKRKGKDAGIEDITEEDRQAFSAYFFETYMQKVTSVLRRIDPNHMYLGCRFNQEPRQELTNPEIFRVAGQYMDIISINHYRKWEPDQNQLQEWREWSGRPFLITEWYVKGEDSGLPNATGAGWNVETQDDRGLFYENFTLGLLRSPYSVGWHWFRYQDNDPEDLSTDPSNRDSNKGIVDRDYNPWTDLLNRTRNVNNQVYNLTRFFDAQKNN
ncbi:MAG: hypothetical protein LIP01_09230 [Tannerellaceae bacterium]|nr:hypothetical protein [Tannerellaceae bacterium]